MKVYIAGPMSGIPSFNIPAFDAAAADLRNLAYDVVSPAELDDPSIRALEVASPDGDMAALTAVTKETWGDFLARDVKLIADGGIDAIAVLPGWHTSRGARLEVTVATLDSKPIYAYEGTSSPTALRRLTPGEVDAGKLGREPERTDCRGIQHESPADALRELLKRPYGEQPPAEREALRELMERPHGAKLPVAGEVRVVNEKTGGAKGSKAQQMGLLPYEALMKVSEVYAFGATKYAPNNWRKGYDWSLSFDALQRHLALFWSGEDLDPETGLPHLAHAAFHVLALIVFMLDPRYAELDDRASTVMTEA